MGASYELDLHFGADPLKKFLADDGVETFSFHPKNDAPDGMHDSGNQKDAGTLASDTQVIEYPRIETWRMFEGDQPTNTGGGESGGNTVVGDHIVTTIMRRELEISVAFRLFLKNGLSAEATAHANDLLNNYELQDGGTAEDVERYIVDNLDGKLTQSDFSLIPWPTLRKTNFPFAPYEVVDGNTQRPLPIRTDERNVDQRYGLFSLYLGREIGDPEVRSDVSIGGGDGGLDQWARGRNISFKLIHLGPTTEDEPREYVNVREVNAGQGDDPQYAEITLDDILRHVVPGGCAELDHWKEKLLRILGWPEFKTKWKKKRIKIGCAKITIWYPAFYIRTASIYVWGYASWPRNVGRTARVIVETCLIRSALGSAIIGIISSNIAAAQASFIPLFKQCVSDEIERCLTAGLFLLKEHDDWTRI